MRLSLGISTCPNDTYIYEALVAGLENSPFEWDVHFADVQTLNEMVCRGELDVAKVSAQVYPKIREDYVCLVAAVPSGTAAARFCSLRSPVPSTRSCP